MCSYSDTVISMVIVIVIVIVVATTSHHMPCMRILPGWLETRLAQNTSYMILYEHSVNLSKAWSWPVLSCKWMHGLQV